MSGVTIRSIMSVSTVKVGTTMKSMNPGDKDIKDNVSMSTFSTTGSMISALQLSVNGMA